MPPPGRPGGGIRVIACQNTRHRGYGDTRSWRRPVCSAPERASGVVSFPGRGKTVTCSSMELQAAEVDVVVAGSGAAGLTAALTAAHLGLSVLVIEKAGHFGGSTARSGGGIWAPGNTVLRDARVADTPEQARAYLAYVAEGVPAGRREALLEHGPDMLSLVLATTPLRFAWVPGYADYYPEAPGGPGRRAQHRAGSARRPAGARRGAGSSRPALPALAGGHHAGRVPLAEPGTAPAGHPRRAAGRGPGRAGQAARAADAQPGAGAGRGAAGRAADGRRAGLAGHPAGRPGGGRRPGDRGPRHQGRGAGADPGAARGADRHRRLRARRADAPPLPARAGRDRVDDRRGREHRRRDPGGPGPRRGHRADGRRLVGAVDPAARRPVLLPGRAQPAGLRPGQRRGPAVRQRVGAVRRRGARHVRRQHAGEPAHPGLAGLRPALPRPVRVRRPAAGQGPAAPLVRRRGGAPRGRPGRAGPRRPGSTPTAWSRP